MQILDFINRNFIVLIPVLYIVGNTLKTTTLIKNKYIPLTLLVIGILSSIALEGLNIEPVIQGILITGVVVLGNQTIKQLNKNE